MLQMAWSNRNASAWSLYKVKSIFLSTTTSSSQINKVFSMYTLTKLQNGLPVDIESQTWF